MSKSKWESWIDKANHWMVIAIIAMLIPTVGLVLYHDENPLSIVARMTVLYCMFYCMLRLSNNATKWLREEFIPTRNNKKAWEWCGVGFIVSLIGWLFWTMLEALEWSHYARFIYAWEGLML